MSSFHHHLPPVAAEYIAGLTYDKRKVRHLVGRFHAWFELKQVGTSEINTDFIDPFIRLPWARELADSTKFLYGQHLERYVGWLGERGYTRSTKKSVASTRLPKTAWSFIQELQSTLSPGTCKFYRCVLRGWFQWAGPKGIDTCKLTRKDVVEYGRTLYERGLAPETRGHYLATLRRYLFYLDDQGLLANKPRNLIRSSDFPKPPRLLPRALRPDIDAELCARLATASDIRCQGLLLMRHTGMRVGELTALELDCVREDRYLKVPLGKLKSERLVPLNDEALALVRALQERGRSGRDWLIENPRRQKPYCTGSYHTSIRPIRDGLEKSDGLEITTHRLRHTFATELLNAGLSLAALRQLLGHRSMNMTLRYVSLVPNRLRQDYLAANAKARERYGKVPDAPRTAQLADDTTSADTIADVVRRIKRDAATLSEAQRTRARRAARQLKNLGILLDELGL